MLVRNLFGCTLTIAIAINFIGCDSGGGKKGASMDQVAGAVDAQKAAKQQEAANTAAKAAADQQAAQQAAAAQPAEPEKKAVGSRPQMEGGGYFRAIGSARRHVMNVADSLAWIQGVRSFKAEEGRKPKDNNEFMRVVVPKYELQLPRIEADEEYLYDPNGESDGDFGQLYVVKKQTAEAVPGTSSQPPAPAPGQN
jgi:hypothetical protein